MKLTELNDIIVKLIENHDTGNYASEFIEKICIANNWPYGELWILDETESFMRCKVSWSMDVKGYAELFHFSSICKFSKGVGFIGKPWQTGELLFCADITKEKEFLRTDIAIKHCLFSVVCSPVYIKQNVVAILCFFMNKLSNADINSAETLQKSNRIIGRLLEQFIVMKNG
ncbi:MAG: GAF domain-containing protein [Ignavibacteriales bacterium]|nr:GAF domain-containing protein [Ignavibacteriales bacterium]